MTIEMTEFVDVSISISPTGVSGGNFGILGFLTRMFAGGTFGESAQQGIQSLRGVQEQTLPEQGTQALQQGGLSTVGGTIGVGLGGAVEPNRPSLTMALWGPDRVRSTEGDPGLPEMLDIPAVG